MADTTLIEWADATWNPVTGCRPVSAGCNNCYAARLAATRMKNDPSRIGLARINAKGVAKFNGKVRFNAKWLDQPLRWKKPRLIFVVAHGDLFAEEVPTEWIDQVFAVMAMAPQHVFQVLTKRPERMRDFIGHPSAHLSDAAERIGYRVMERMPDEGVAYPGHWSTTASALIHGATPDLPGVMYPRPNMWPLPNVWIGTSVENQTSADLRVPALIETPAAKRFISAEPMLGPVDLARWLHGLDWIICGGESGPKASPMHPDWARELRDQAALAKVPFLFKQWGEWLRFGETDADGLCNTRDRGEEPGLWQSWGNGEFSVRVGKKQAGRHLDGIEHLNFPERG